MVVVKLPVTDAPVALYVPPVRDPPDTDPAEKLPPVKLPPEMVAPLIEAKLEIVLVPLPLILPVDVNAPIFDVLSVLTVSVPLVPVSASVKSVFASASF